MTTTDSIPAKDYDLGNGQTIKGAHVHLNPGVDDLYNDAIRLGEGVKAATGPLTVRTNKTGRSPKDRFIVEDAETKENVWWEGFNVPIGADVFDNLLDKMPPKDATWANYPYYDTSWFDSFGRSYFLQATYKFGGKPL